MEHSDPETLRSKMHSPYMEWAKTQSQARYTLASSGMPGFPMSELTAMGTRIEDLEINGPPGYGYPPLQQALAEKCGVSTDCVVAASGTSLANHLAMAASFDPGDEVLIEEPTYELLLTTAHYLGAKIRRFQRRFEDGYRVDRREVERALTPQTRLIVISNLHNPSSAFTSDDALREIGEMAKRVRARVLVDEVYLETLFSTPWKSAFHLGDNFVITSSLTKAYGLSGLRCGWVLAQPDLARAMWHLNDFYGVVAAHPAERLSLAALKNLPAIAARARDILAANRPLVEKFFDSRPDLQVARQPHGTVLFPRVASGDSGEFCKLLREKYETSVVPGSFFESPAHFRLFLGAAPETTREGLKRIAAALDELKVSK